MKNRGNYDKLISSIDSLTNELNGGKYPSAYSIFQHLFDIKTDLSLVIDSEIDYTYTKIYPIINKIICELHQLKKKDIKSSSKLTSLFNEAGPIISDCRSHLHYAEKKARTKTFDYPKNTNNFINLKPETKSIFERVALIIGIIAAIVTILSFVFDYC